MYSTVQACKCQKQVVKGLMTGYLGFCNFASSDAKAYGEHFNRN